MQICRVAIDSLKPRQGKINNVLLNKWKQSRPHFLSGWAKHFPGSCHLQKICLYRKVAKVTGTQGVKGVRDKRSDTSVARVS